MLSNLAARFRFQPVCASAELIALISASLRKLRSDKSIIGCTCATISTLPPDRHLSGNEPDGLLWLLILPSTSCILNPHPRSKLTKLGNKPEPRPNVAETPLTTFREKALRLEWGIRLKQVRRYIRRYKLTANGGLAPPKSPGYDRFSQPQGCPQFRPMLLPGCVRVVRREEKDGL